MKTKLTIALIFTLALSAFAAGPVPVGDKMIKDVDTNGFGLWNLQTVGDANLTIATKTDNVRITAALTTPRTYTLPLASAFKANRRLFILDPIGAVSGTNTVSIARAGSDTVNGGTTATALNAAYKFAMATCDGVSKWSVVQLGGGGGGGGDVVLAADNIFTGINHFNAAGGTFFQYSITVGQNAYISGLFALLGEITPPTLTGDVNDYSPTGFSTASALNMNGGAADRNITGLSNVDGIGRLMRINNAGTTNKLTLKNESASSASSKRFHFANGDAVIKPGGTIVLYYSQAALRWTLFDGGNPTVDSFVDPTSGYQLFFDISSFTANHTLAFNAAGYPIIAPTIQTVGNADATVSAGVTSIQLTTTLTAPRVYTLAAASSYPPGVVVRFTDLTNSITPTNKVSFARAGSDTINGGTANVDIITKGAVRDMLVDGVSKYQLSGLYPAPARVTTITSSATPTVNTDSTDVVTITAQAAAITSMTTNLTGTPNNFDQLEYRIKDNGTARAITWGASFVSGSVALPTTTVVSKALHVWLEYDSVQAKWVCVGTGSDA